MIARTRWLTVAGLLAVGFAGGMFSQLLSGGRDALAANEGGPEIVRAQGFVLVDSAGATLGSLRADPGGARIVLSDAGGHERLALGPVVMPHVPEQHSWGLVVSDDGGKARCALGLADGAGVAVWDPQGTLRIGIGEGAAGVGIALNDGQGKPRFGVGMPPHAGASMGFTDEEGVKTWSAP